MRFIGTEANEGNEEFDGGRSFRTTESSAISAPPRETRRSCSRGDAENAELTDFGCGSAALGLFRVNPWLKLFILSELVACSQGFAQETNFEMLVTRMKHR